MAIDIQPNDLVACICEGGAENVIIDLLLEKDLLIFSKKQMIDEKVLAQRYKKSSIFENELLTLDYESEEANIIILLIVDKYSEYKIRRYKDKIKAQYYAVTSPEIEMLHIHALDCYADYMKEKTKVKPSEYLKSYVGIKGIKSIDNNKLFWGKYDLIDAINKYASNCPSRGKKSIISLKDLIK